MKTVIRGRKGKGKKEKREGGRKGRREGGKKRQEGRKGRRLVRDIYWDMECSKRAGI